MLSHVFKELQSRQDKLKFLKSNKGEEFEDKLITSMKRNGLNHGDIEEFHKGRLFDVIKKNILDKDNDEWVENPLTESQYKDTFFYQPYGTQQFPDFIVLLHNNIIAIECKFGKTKPVWNSNIPRQNGIYIFGSFESRDVTFFLGCDVILKEEEQLLLRFFDGIKKQEEEFEAYMKKLIEEKELSFNRGWQVYIRKAFEQSKQCNPNADLDFFTSPNREYCEDNTIKLIRFLEK